MSDRKHGLRPCAVAFAVAFALGLSGCGGGGGGGANVRPTQSPPPPIGGSDFTGGDVNVDAGNTTVWPADIGGSIDLVKGGAGTLVLTGTDSYTGGTTISAGTLQLGNGGTTGWIVGDVTDNGSLVFDRSDNVTFAGVVSGSGSLTQAGTGALTLTGNNTYTGGTTISAGTLQLGNGGTTGWIVGDVTDNGSLVFDRSDNVSFAGAISGNGSLTQAGTGTLTLTGNSTYTGGTAISAGTLQLGNGGTTGWIVGGVTDNGSLVFDRSDNVTFAGVVSGNGSLTQAGTGTLTLAVSNIYTGATTISAGTLALMGGGSIASSSGVSDAGTFDISGTSNGATIASLSGNGAVALGAQTLTLSSAVGTFGGVINGTGGLALAGGTEILTGTNTYGDATTISAGTLQLGNGGTTGSIAGDVTDNGSLVFDRSDNVTFSGVVSGSGSLTQAGTGTLNLTGGNTYTGTTTISAGTLALTGSGSVASSSGVSDAGTFDITGTSNGATIASLSGSGTVMLGAQTLTLSNAVGTFGGVISGTGGLALLGGTEMLTGANTYSGAATISAGTLQLGNGGTTGSIAGDVTDNGSLVFDRSDNVTFSGIVSGSGSLTQAGTGTLSLTGDNTYTGGTTIGAGTLQLGNGGTSGSVIGNVTDNGALAFNQSSDEGYGGIVSGTGSLTQSGAGTLTLTGANTYTGATTVSTGTLALTGGGSVASSSGVSDAGTFDISGTSSGATIKSLSGSGAVTLGAQTLTLSNATGTFGGVIGGTGGLILAGGTEILSGANTYAGGTIISAGTLQLGDGGTSGSVIGNVMDSGTLAFDQSGNVSYGAIVSSTGSLTQLGSGTLTLTSANTYTGATTISAGTLALAGSGSVASSNGVSDAGIFDISGTSSGATIASLSGTGTVALGAQTLTLSNASGMFAGVIRGVGGLTLTGGTEILTGTNAYSGSTAINAGTLQLGNGGSTGSIVGDVTDNGALVFDHVYSEGISGLVSGSISGSGSLTQAGAGTLILTGNDTYTGGTTISNGILQLGNLGTTGAIVGNVTDNGALVFEHTDNVVFSGTVSGSGSLTQAGTGTLILAGNNTYTGGSTISSGNLQLGNGGTAGSIVGNVTNNGYNSSLVFDRSDDWSYGGTVSGSGGLVKIGGDTLTMSGVNTYTGPTTVEGGALKIAAGGTLGFTTISVTNATFEIDNGATVSGRATLGAGAMLDNAGVFLAMGVSPVQMASLSDAVTVVNHDGGLIEDEPAQVGLNAPAIQLGANSVLTNGAGSTIKGPAGVSTSGVVNNAGGSIVGIFYDGVDGAASVNNSAGGLIVSGTGAGILSIGVMTNVTSAVVGNAGGSIIRGVLDGVWLGDGGAVTNDGVSTISGNTGIFIASMSSATGVVNNTGGSTISGKKIGVELEYGGAITNGPGSIIETAAIASGDCSSVLNCAVYVPIYSAYGSYGSNGELNFSNAGVVVGDVQMDPSAINNVTLVAGGSINGYLDIGSNTQSTLTLDGGVGTTQLYSNAVSGATTFGGDLIKNGDGTWVIDNANLQGVVNTSINAGSLQSMQVLFGAVSVNAPGKLDGVPGVAGSLSNAGAVTVHGGDTTVGGSYTQASTGTLAVSLGSKLAVTGTATLNGGTLEVTGADSGYVANTHTNVLTAAGGLTGTFAQLVKDSGVVFTSTTIQYDANSAWLDTTGLNVTTAAAGAGVSYTPASMSSAVRVEAAFEQLDSRIATNNLSGVSSNFLQAAGQFQQAPTLQAAQASLQSLSGELHADSAAMTFEAIDASSRALSDRFDQLLGKGVGYGVWTQSLDMGGNMARTGYDSVGFQLNGWLVGNDRQIGHSGVAGFAFGQSQGLQQLDQGYGRDNSRSTESMVYAGWLDGNWYTQGRVGFGQFRQDINRQLLLGYSTQGVSTRYSGNYSVAYGESGFYLNHGGTRITPFVDVEYASIDRGGFAEQGAGGFGLRSGGQALDRWQSGLGVRVDRRWDLGDGRAVKLGAHAQWQRTLASHGDVFDASFVGLQQWQPLTGIGLSRYGGLFGFRLDTTLSAHTALNFGYDYEMGQRVSGQMLSASLNVAF